MDGWRKSTYSFSNSNCVEVREDPSGTVAVRDSKDPGGPVLAFTRAGWDAFIKGVKSGERDSTPPAASARGSASFSSLEARIAADYPDNPILAALRSPSPARPRRARRGGSPAPARTRKGLAGDPPAAGQDPQGSRAPAVTPAGPGSSGKSAAVGSYRMIRAYAVTLVPGEDGTARIDPEAALRFARRAGNWSHAARAARQQRAYLLGAMALLAGKGDLDKREGVASYWTWPAGHEGGADPVIAEAE